MTKREAYAELNYKELGVTKRSILAAMKNYDEDWWETGTPFEIVENQLDEDILLVPLDRWLKCLSTVVKRKLTVSDYIDQAKYQDILKEAYDTVN